MDSFILLPLLSENRILGFLAVDKGPVSCEWEDLDLLKPLVTKLGIAIDKAMAYEALERLTQTLEHRVQERTHELEHTNEKLKDFDRLKSLFVSTASHELRTPLTSIKLLTENLLQGVGGTLSQEHQQYLTRIQVNVKRLHRLLAELLDLSQIETGRMKLSLEPISPQEMIHEAVGSLTPLAQEKGVTLQATSLESLPLMSGDRDKLIQILSNLIHNAVKFTATGGQVEILGRRLGNDLLQFCIADSGCGIVPEDISQIFLPFYRGKVTPSAPYGVGLGLTITKHLVDLHQGHLDVESTSGQGSRFYVTMPIRSLPLP